MKNLLKNLQSLTGNDLRYKLASAEPTDTKSRYNVAEETKIKQSTFIHSFISICVNIIKYNVVMCSD